MPSKAPAPDQPIFYYDLSSPYAWLAAERVESVLPQSPVWQPISYAFVLKHLGKTPWSVKPGRERQMREIERRAEERGLPPLRWPDGWPVATYSLPALRAAVYAAGRGKAAAFSLAAFRQQFTGARGLNELATVLGAATACGLDADEVRDAVELPEIKEKLKRSTNEAIARGLTGIPTIQTGRRLFWGDDQLERAAEAIDSQRGVVH